MFVKNIFISFLLLFSINVSAHNWHKVSEINGESLYVDVDDIKKQNGFVYYFELVDLKDPKFGTLSIISKYKADCLGQEKAMLSTTSFTGQMGRYLVTNEAEYDGTRFIDSSLSSEMKFACERAK
jgi:hypothetical protein